MRKTPSRSFRIAFSYAEIASRAKIGIRLHMRAARKNEGVARLARQEIACAVYLGSRTLVESYAQQAAYPADDTRLEALKWSMSNMLASGDAHLLLNVWASFFSKHHHDIYHSRWPRKIEVKSILFLAVKVLQTLAPVAQSDKHYLAHAIDQPEQLHQLPAVARLVNKSRVYGVGLEVRRLIISILNTRRSNDLEPRSLNECASFASISILVSMRSIRCLERSRGMMFLGESISSILPSQPFKRH